MCQQKLFGTIKDFDEFLDRFDSVRIEFSFPTDKNDYGYYSLNFLLKDILGDAERIQTQILITNSNSFFAFIPKTMFSYDNEDNGKYIVFREGKYIDDNLLQDFLYNKLKFEKYEPERHNSDDGVTEL